MNKKISIIILFVALGALGVYFMSGEKPPTIDQQFQSIINELNKHAHLLNNFKNGDDVEIMQSEYISYRFNIKQIIDNINDKMEEMEMSDAESQKGVEVEEKETLSDDEIFEEPNAK